MKGAFVFLVICLGAVPAIAQTEALEATCGDDDQEMAARVAACDGLITTPDYPRPEWAYLQRGRAKQDATLHAEAIADFNEALAIMPATVLAVERRMISFYGLQQYENALRDTSTLIELAPDQDWYFYRHGLNLSRLDRFAEAVAALDTALELDPDYFFSWYQRGMAQHGLANYPAAISDLTRARGMRPFTVWVYERLGDAAREMADVEAAIGYYRIANTMDRNRRDAPYWLRELLTLEPDTVLPPMAFSMPPAGQQIDYFQVVVPVDERDQMEEMELAIFALQDWFMPHVWTVPDAMAFTSRKIGETEGNNVALEINITDADNMNVRPGEYPRSADTWFGILPKMIQPGGPGGPEIKISYDDGEPADIWPLEVGKSVTGTGRFDIQCPEEFNVGAMLIGCLADVETLPAGSLEFSIQVVRAQQIHVPLGVFDTYEVRYRELAFVELLGVKNERIVETSWWFSPETSFWVKRKILQGDKIGLAEAIAITNP